MIETRIIKSLRITLHNLNEYNWSKKEYPDETNFEHYENSEEYFNADDIAKVFKENGITHVQVLNEDYQGGSHIVPVLDDYEELKDILEHKKELLK